MINLINEILRFFTIVVVGHFEIGDYEMSRLFKDWTWPNKINTQWVFIFIVKWID